MYVYIYFNGKYLEVFRKIGVRVKDRGFFLFLFYINGREKYLRFIGVFFGGK